MKKQISIVGGGTAGWLSALYAKKLYGDSAEVTLIESEEIGILGAGEGSTAVFVSFLQDLEINLIELLREVNGTHKIGVSFENWNNDGKKYIHDFFSTDYKRNPVGTLEYFGYLLKNNFTIDDYLISKKIAWKNLSPMDISGTEIVHHSFHFDAHLLAKYLRKVAELRGVKRIEGIISNFSLNNYDDIESIHLNNGQTIPTNFVFDCSGFARLIIGGLYKAEWVSYKDKLTVNSAIPFQLPPDTDHIKPYTRAIAMKYGWVWQIPLQNRWGCGYVFDSNLITKDEALVEIENVFGVKIETPRVIKFEAGRFNKIWIKNCIAVGLAGSFVEPLEATSIGMTVGVLKSLTKFDIDFKNPIKINSHNFLFNDLMDDIVDFLQYHYITKRNDTDFWKYYSNSNNWSKNLKNNIDILKNSLDIKLGNSIFASTSYACVGFGLEQINKNVFINKFEKENNINKDLLPYYKKLDTLTKEINKKVSFISELEYINKIIKNENK